MSKIDEALEHAMQEGKGTMKQQAIPLPQERLHKNRILTVESEMISLYQYIADLLPDSAKKVIQFIGSQEGEGASTIVREFAAASAHRLGKKVIIVDANQLNPGQHLFFGIRPEYGWGDAMGDSGEIEKAIYQVKDSSLYVCPTSPKYNANHLVFDSNKIEHFLGHLKERFDLVLVDSPSVAVLPDGIAIARKVDGIVLVLEAEKTRWPVVQNAIEKIQKSGGYLLGIVFNKQRYYIPECIYRWL